MGFWKGVKKAGGFVFNFKVSQWLDYETIKGGLAYFVSLARSIYSRKPGTGFDETYEMAKERLNLTDAEIELQAKNYLLISWVYLIASLGLLGYTAYLLYHRHFLSGSLTACITLYAITFCIRNHFWHYQLKQKRLGCSLVEWFSALFGVKNNVQTRKEIELQCHEMHEMNENQVKNYQDVTSEATNNASDDDKGKYESLYGDKTRN